MNRASKRLRQSKQLPMAIFKPAKLLVVLPILLCLCPYPRAGEADDDGGGRTAATATAPRLPANPWQCEQGDSQQAPSLPQLCPPPSLASSRRSQAQPCTSSHPSTLYMETFNVAHAAEEFKQLTIVISEITSVVLGSQNKPYLPN